MLTSEKPSTADYALTIVSNVLNVISSLCCIGIIILYITAQNTRSFSTSIVFQLCIWCLISHFIVLIIDPSYLTGPNNKICQVQGALLTTFNTALLFWPTLLFTISFINFKKPEFFSKYNIRSTIVTGLIGWTLPIIWGVM